MYIYRADEIRQIDQQAAEQGFSLFSLMENAGRGLFNKIMPLIKKDDRMIVLSGRGNNGGDGIVLSRYLRMAGYNVSLVFPLGRPKSETAKQHLDYYFMQDEKVDEWNPNQVYDVIIDCLLGIGTTLPLRENVKQVVSWSNEQDALRIAVDIPTGVQADHGHVPDGEAFLADYSFSLHGVKPSIFLLPSGKYFGKTESVSIGLKQGSELSIITKKSVIESFPSREKASHKGTFGTSLIVAGTDHMPGSAVLTAIGAIRSGTGKLVMATTERVASVIASTVPEATYLLNGLEQICQGHIPEKIAAAGIGPGLESPESVQKATEVLMESGIPLVVDAGAIQQRNIWNAKGPVILTPHPGEFSRLTGLSIEEIQANRIELACNYAMHHHVTVVLKGNDTVIAFPNGEIYINQTGNSGLAKGGSGDVLTGMIVSMLATHDNYRDAVKNAVYIHGLCADIRRETYSETSMVASDFHRLLPLALQRIERYK
ncbi:MAG TPA: NAD(P)H-hydrate dehydratase [Cerasibacillus sp.]|uniref:NAD(P)H-hydrate dehydratase n=1 Tax=Cerasibacillus sp. TaxID=2498711 RepID=UPI002F41008E